MKNRARAPLVLLAAGILVIGLWGGLKAYRLVTLARSFQDRLEAVQTSGALDDPKSLDPMWATEMVHGTRADFLALEKEIRPWIWLAPALYWLPEIGPDLRLGSQFLEMGDASTKLAVLLADSLLPVFELFQKGELATESLIEKLAEARPDLAAAGVELERIAVARAAIPPGDYASITTKLLEKLDQYLDRARLGLRGAELLPGAMGADGLRTYLLIAQNEDEIRPTGGFISSGGLLTVDEGEILDLAFESSDTVDDWANHPYPQLPVPYQEIMGDGIWLFRDANWSPDWPTSARQAIELYQISREVTIDGVIAVDQQAVQLLVGPLGPLVVREGFAAVVAGNVLDFMREAWIDPAEGGATDWQLYRKAFIGDLAAVMKDTLLDDIGSIDLSALASAAITALDEKHILLYFQDQDLASIAHQAGWDGALASPPGDFLMVVDANMGFNKVAPVIRPQIDYRIALGDYPEAQLVLTYAHLGEPRDEACRHEPYYESTLLGYVELTDRCYWNYVRVFPAAGTVPLEGSRHPLSGDFLTSRKDWPGEMVVSQETGGRLSLANFFLLPWGQSQVLSFRYQLPPAVVTVDGARRRYRLFLQKQPGTTGNPARVVVQLPAGATLLGTAPAATVIGDELLFELVLRTDREITVEWSPP